MSLNAKLHPLWAQRGKLEQKPTRNGFGEGLLEAGKENEDIVTLTADLAESTRAHLFAEAFPERFFEVGVAEQNMMGIAAGLALSGKIPFATSYAVFSPGRNWDQLRVSVCYSKANVKIIGGHAGLSVGPDGATHQALEDIALTRVLPNLKVIVPSDALEAYKATRLSAEIDSPVYIRLARSSSPVYTTDETPFQIGKANTLHEGKDVTIVATGLMVYEALEAAHVLSSQNIWADVINIHTIKPLDSATVLDSLQKTNRLVTVEEHQVAGGLGSAILEAVAGKWGGPTKLIGINDEFGESGSHIELFQKFNLTSKHIVNTVYDLIIK